MSSSGKKKSGGGLLGKIKRGVKSFRTGVQKRRQKSKAKRAKRREVRHTKKAGRHEAGLEALRRREQRLLDAINDPNIPDERRAAYDRAYLALQSEIARGEAKLGRRQLKISRAQKKKSKAKERVTVLRGKGQGYSAGPSAQTPVPRPTSYPPRTRWNEAPPPPSALPSTPAASAEEAMEGETEKEARINSRISELERETQEYKECIKAIDHQIQTASSLQQQKEWYDARKDVVSYLAENAKKIECNRCKKKRNTKRWYERSYGIQSNLSVEDSDLLATPIACPTGTCAKRRPRQRPFTCKTGRCPNVATPPVVTQPTCMGGTCALGGGGTPPAPGIFIDLSSGEYAE